MQPGKLLMLIEPLQRREYSQYWQYGSILSIGSTGSILSIGSVGSILCIGSAGSLLGIGRRGATRKQAE